MSAFLTPLQQRLVRESFASAGEYSDAVVQLFYGRLFELDPAVRGMFKIDIKEQSRKLLDMLSTIVGALDNFEELRPKLGELGRRHVTYGVKPEHYETLKRALLWALGRALDSEFDAETRAAWAQLLDAVAAAMLAPESVTP
jgi:hemoglobin-like flavoprotein